MTESKSLKLQLQIIAAIFVLPYIGGYIYYSGVFPEHYFLFPHLSAVDKACFSYPLFIGACIFAIGVLLFFLFPSILGFKKVSVPIEAPVPKVSLPRWFWVGLVMWASALSCYVFQWQQPKLLINWANIPLFWGLTLMLDGWVYIRKGGKSIISDYPKSMIGIGVSAILGWLLFEYLNNFVLECWFYPIADLIPQDEFAIYAVIGSAGLIPPAIEFYDLQRTFKGHALKYSQGPKITWSKWTQNIVLALSLLSLFLAPFFPNYLFAALWYAPLAMIAIVLTWGKIWTPFTPIKDGNYSYVMLLALSYLFTGLCMECFNYLSATHILGSPNNCGEVFNIIEKSYNPSYWQYSIPLLNKYHIFEMPALGFLGYLPFGIYCAVWWILFASILGIKTDFENNAC